MTDDHTYLEQLERALTTRGVEPERAAAVIGEVSDHLTESGEQPLHAFGEPEQYATALLAADGPLSDHGEAFERHTFRATAIDELRVLAELGTDGWELTGVRDFGLHARRPLDAQTRTRWEYSRRSGLRAAPMCAQMQAEHWTPCGRWLTFHYFKRPDDTFS